MSKEDIGTAKHHDIRQITITPIHYNSKKRSPNQLDDLFAAPSRLELELF
ncbi:MAG: hypothetical protein J6T30_07500 [Bacteroidales bacterium]|nr:hypothetical protein [Bacteroidales bacterium]